MKLASWSETNDRVYALAAPSGMLLEYSQQPQSRTRCRGAENVTPILRRSTFHWLWFPSHSASVTQEAFTIKESRIQERESRKGEVTYPDDQELISPIR